MGAPDTIFALSSGRPPAAIAVVRISGPAAHTAMVALAGSNIPKRSPVVRTLRWRGEVLDRALLLFFPGPGSATGEDLGELHLHGGRAVVDGVLGALAEIPGLVPATPGAFTRRAFDNGRIDLAEAEGLADLLEAETESQRRAALALAGGALTRLVADWRTRLLDLAAAVEAILDFSDEDDVTEPGPAWHTARAALAQEIAAFLARPPVERLKDGVRVVLAGPPNAGKSTLLNALAGREAAIVSDIAGTTRDVIEVPVSLVGIPFLLTDTAGLRDGGDSIERIGIDRAQDRINVADILVWLGPVADAPHGAVILLPKSDLRPQLHSNVGAGGPLPISAMTGEGLDRLVAELIGRARHILPDDRETLGNRRQRAELQVCLEVMSSIEGQTDLLLIAESLRSARHALDRTTGGGGVEDMLDRLFGRFCIGK